MTILNSAPGPSLSSRAAAHGDSDDDFEDATDLMDDDDAIFLPEKSSSRRIQPLIPDDFGSDDTMAAIRFSEEFANRYGDPHPSFFPGSLDDAIRESCTHNTLSSCSTRPRNTLMGRVCPLKKICQGTCI